MYIQLANLVEWLVTKIKGFEVIKLSFQMGTYVGHHVEWVGGKGGE